MSQRTYHALCGVIAVLSIFFVVVDLPDGVDVLDFLPLVPGAAGIWVVTRVRNQET